MISILMVCLGNICRSPLAHGILESKLSKNLFYIDSAGTAAYHIGNKPDPRSIEIAKINGININTQRARQFRIEDFETFDYIYAMDEANYENIINLARNQNDIDKVHLFLEANSSVLNKNVPDPYYGDSSDFESVFKLINETCDIIQKPLSDLHS